MTIPTLARSQTIPEGAPPCDGLSHLFNTGRVDDDLLPSLLACCARCHMTRQCAQTALDVEGPLTGSVKGVWGGVYIISPKQRSGPLHDMRLQALARLQAVADPNMAVA